MLWEVDEAADTIWELFDIALERENLTSVRCSMMKVLTPFFNKDKKRFADAIRRLIVLPQNQLGKTDTFRLSPLITHAGISLFPYIFYWLPDLADDLAEELLNNGDETQQLIGAWLIFRESFRNDVYVVKANELATQSVDRRRLLSGVTADAISWTENKTRAEDLLKAFFLDEDKQVREHAADVFRNVKAEEIEQLRGLTANFIRSPAFNDSGSTVLYMLENATCDVLDLVLDATERLIADMADVNNRQGRKGADLYHLQDLLKREYASSEGSVEARRKILDMIDCLLFHDIQGVESIVSTHDRW